MFADIASPSPLLTRHLGPHAQDAADVGWLRFRDVEEQASALTGWNQHYLQLSAGTFHGELCQLHGPGIRLFVERMQQSVLQIGVLPGDVLAVGIPLETSGSGLFCGQPCGTDDFHVFSGACGFEFRSSRQHTMLGIELQLERGWLSAAASGQQPWATQAGVWRMAPAALAELKAYLLTLWQSAQAQPGLLAKAAVVSTVADFLLDRMAQASRGGAADLRMDTCSLWQLVQQARARVKDTPGPAPTVAQLCLDLDVSRRTLQNGFQRVLGVSPLAYLKAVRLDQARRALKRVSSVTEAATAHGFWHFGHFSQDYQAMFGEQPSATLRRHSTRS